MLIEHLRRLLAEGLDQGLLRRVSTSVAYRSDDGVHAVVCDGLEGDFGDLLEIILSTGRDVLVSEEDFLRDTTTEGHAYPVEHLRCGEQVSVWG